MLVRLLDALEKENRSMYNEWPLGQVPKEIQRPELEQLAVLGYTWQDPYDIVAQFEQQVADFAGARYGIAVDCCSHGLFLSLKYLKAQGTVTIPANTYISVPMNIMHAGCAVELESIAWSGIYQLHPYPVWDAAVRWHKNMYQGGLHVVSFQLKKRIPIGRGGMILTDDEQAYEWLRRARHDGRSPGTPYIQDDIEIPGWHYYMTPEDAARGLLLLQNRLIDFPDSADHTNYDDLRQRKIFRSAT
jgi:dTDP-4-amino-4,6-dideoxygalactose transaminase